MIDDPFSLLSLSIWLMAASMYPLAFMLGSTCSPCCNQCSLNNTSITTATVEIEAEDWLVQITKRIDVGGGDFADELVSYGASYGNLDGTFLLDPVEPLATNPASTRNWFLELSQQDGCTPARPYQLRLRLANDLSLAQTSFGPPVSAIGRRVNFTFEIDQILWKSQADRKFDSGLYDCDAPKFYDYRGTNFDPLPCVFGKTDCIKNDGESVAWEWEQTCNPSNGNLTTNNGSAVTTGFFDPEFNLATDYPAGSFVDSQSATVIGVPSLGLTPTIVLKDVFLS